MLRNGGFMLKARSRLLAHVIGTSTIAASALFAQVSNIPKDYKGTPFEDAKHKGLQTVPGRVECVYYDRGGEGVAYHDTDGSNHGSGELNPANGTYLNEFRKGEGVDTSYTKLHNKPDPIDNNTYDKVQPPDNLLYVGWTQPGEWFNITVEVAHAGTYTADL